MGGFFDDYPDYYGNDRGRRMLNHRHRVIVEDNRHVFEGCRVLDLASRDGKWSFAALQAGATRVAGVEGRRKHVRKAKRVFRKYSIPRRQYKFICGDVFQEIDRFRRGSFETVMILGFLYHTTHHMWLLEKLCGLGPKHLIVDATISFESGPFVELRWEDTTVDGASISRPGDRGDRTLVGLPTREAIEMMFTCVGYRIGDFFQWGPETISDWDEIQPFKDANRVTFTAERA